MYPLEKNLFLLPDSARFHIFSFLDETQPLQGVSRRFKQYHDNFISDNVDWKPRAEWFGKMALQIKTVNTTWREVYKTFYEIIQEKNREYCRTPVFIWNMPKRTQKEVDAERDLAIRFVNFYLREVKTRVQLEE